MLQSLAAKQACGNSLSKATRLCRRVSAKTPAKAKIAAMQRIDTGLKLQSRSPQRNKITDQKREARHVADAE
jgi:hypothetical protein